ncbi:MAG TPA: tetratricopeptide repeat protein [Candidatus Sulfopaludibacter sp.]|jgi:tetratricopeptide (TPR) repeat protein|nr:tetratricopeptide repeat protein [Candidatus Sulfopaludibacter sp.]
MSRTLRHLSVLLLAAIPLAAQDGGAISKALAALRGGDSSGAEQILRSEIKLHPNDAGGLTLLGVALDNQKKFQEAGEMHRRASTAAPNSPDVLNNFANHLIATGDEEGARKLYLHVVELDPASYNANVQLARMALNRKNGGEAMACLSRLPAAQGESASLAPLRIAALYLAGETREAGNLADRWLITAKNDLPTTFSIGVALAGAGELVKAETFFTQALALAPSDFNLLSNLGVLSWRIGKLDRARELLEAARRQQPDNVDVLYDLASVDQAASQPESALPLLAQAARLAPQRADVQKLLALAAGDVGALNDAAKAWDVYLKLQPGDDVARRERGFTAFQMGQFEQGVAELRRFVSLHPNDPVGYFELGAAENKDNPAEALKEFDRALALKNDFPAAHSARGSLYYQMGKPEAALADLEASAAQRPNDAVSLDRLGQTYSALDRSADAVRVLRKAAALAPDDSKMQLHLARALADAGDAAESKIAMDRFRQMGPAVNKAVPGGLIDYLSLSPEQRRADYRRRVERVVHEHPEDGATQVTYLRMLLEDGETTKAADVARQIAALKPAASLLADAGRAMLEAGQYEAAQGLLKQSTAASPSPDAELSLALATDLARAEKLELSGDAAGASEALEEALGIAPTQGNLYRQACLFFLKAKRPAEALRVSDRALKALPENRQILLLRAGVLALANRGEEALRLLEQIQNRWPEWADGWSVASVILRAQGHPDEAVTAMRTAVALGASSPAEAKSQELLPLLQSIPYSVR